MPHQGHQRATGQNAKTIPNTPPASASRMLSVTNCCIGGPRCSQRQPRCHFVLPKLGSRQQQSSHVRAGNQKQHPNSRHQYPQRFRKPLAQISQPSSARGQLQSRLPMPRAVSRGVERGSCQSRRRIVHRLAKQRFHQSSAVAAETPGRIRPIIKNAARCG